jgi:hypothetical protein
MLQKKIFILSLVAFVVYNPSLAQVPVSDTTDLMAQLESEAAQNKAVDYTTATFKTTRLVNGHTVENVGKGVLDVKISHRFGTLNKGAYELFGLDNATMRMGLDYGISKRLMVGVGRSTFQKTYDGFVKFKLLRQSTGKVTMPVTVSYVGTVALMSLKWADTSRKNYFSSRLSYTHQLIIGSKLSEGVSLQIMPTFIHRNLATYTDEPNDLYALGAGGRFKLTRRLSFNVEYYYQIPGYKVKGTTNPLALGFDIETGGHVFQLHFTNSTGMTERNFISGTTGKWEKGDVLFGFNISRVFTIGKNHK